MGRRNDRTWKEGMRFGLKNGEVDFFWRAQNWKLEKENLRKYAERREREESTGLEFSSERGVAHLLALPHSLPPSSFPLSDRYLSRCFSAYVSSAREYLNPRSSSAKSTPHLPFLHPPRSFRFVPKSPSHQGRSNLLGLGSVTSEGFGKSPGRTRRPRLRDLDSFSGHRRDLELEGEEEKKEGGEVSLRFSSN